MAANSSYSCLRSVNVVACATRCCLKRPRVTKAPQSNSDGMQSSDAVSWTMTVSRPCVHSWNEKALIISSSSARHSDLVVAEEGVVPEEADHAGRVTEPVGAGVNGM